MAQDKSKATPLTEEQLIQKNSELEKKASELSEREEKVSAKEAELSEREEKVSAKEADLSEREEKVSAKEADLSEREEKVSAKEAELSEREEKVSSGEDSKVLKIQPGKNFDFQGVTYKFKDSAPKKIRMDGKVYSQDEIIQDDDLLLQLVGGNSGLISKIKE